MIVAKVLAEREACPLADLVWVASKDCTEGWLLGVWDWGAVNDRTSLRLPNTPMVSGSNSDDEPGKSCRPCRTAWGILSAIASAVR